MRCYRVFPTRTPTPWKRWISTHQDAAVVTNPWNCSHIVDAATDSITPGRERADEPQRTVSTPRSYMLELEDITLPRILRTAARQIPPSRLLIRCHSLLDCTLSLQGLRTMNPWRPPTPHWEACPSVTSGRTPGGPSWLNPAEISQHHQLWTPRFADAWR